MDMIEYIVESTRYMITEARLPECPAAQRQTLLLILNSPPLSVLPDLVPARTLLASPRSDKDTQDHYAQESNSRRQYHLLGQNSTDQFRYTRCTR